MRVLIISKELIGSSICHKLKSEGYEIKLYIEDNNWKDCLNNIIPKTNDWEAELDWVGKDGLIIFDDVGYGAEQDHLRTLGFSVIGGSAGGDFIEFDRELFKDLLITSGINYLPSQNFSDTDKAIEFIKNNKGPWVLKQNSHLGMMNHVGEKEDGSDVIEALNSYKKYRVENFNLQLKVTGIEVGVARYFNGQDWVGPIEINHEHKRLYNGDEGPLTHEMGTVMWYSEDEVMPLYTETLAKLKPYLQKVNFRGDIDINCIVDENNIWPLEATPRFGNPSTPLQCELSESSFGEFLSSVARGEKSDYKYSEDFGVVVCIAVPPFPNPPSIINSSIYKTEETKLTFSSDFSSEDMKHIWLEEISLDPETKNYFWSGKDGWVMHISGKGSTISEAKTKAYNVIKKINLPKSFHRTDIGKRVEENDLPKLKAWGWIN